MRKATKLPLVAVLMAFCLLALMGTAYAGTGGNGDAGTRPNNCESQSAVCPSFVYASGSDTTYIMTTQLADLYNQSNGCLVIASPQPKDLSCVGAPITTNDENYYHDVVTNAYPIGSGGGIGELCSHGLANVFNADFARSSRVPISSDCTGLHFVAYARDGISWECFAGDPGAGCAGSSTVPDKPKVHSLTIAQLKNIYVNCSITQWSQVKGTKNVAIAMYVPQPNSGTGVTWAAALGVTLAPGTALTQCIPAGHAGSPGAPGSWVSFENTNTYIHNNGNEINAIFPFSIGVYNTTYGSKAIYGKGLASDDSQLEQINGVIPSIANVSNQSFPVTRELFNVYCFGDPSKGNLCGTDPASPAWVTDFMGENGWICEGENDHEDLNGNPDINPWGNPALPYRNNTATGAVPNNNSLIPLTISNNGFVPLEKQADGTYCQSFST
jgi:ABC-type phosphate transport system substrate-binding protein